MKQNYICIIGFQKEKRERTREYNGRYNGNFSNLGKETNIQVQEAQRIPSKKNPKKPTPRHIIIKMSKVKNKKKISKAVRKSNLLQTRETL